MVLLNSLAKKRWTANLGLKALIWLVILIIRFVRASREADWPLHIHTLKLMWSYLLRLDKLPKNLLKKFLDRELLKRH